MKLRQRIHRRATYDRPKARHRVVMKTLIEATTQVAKRIHHEWTFVGPPKPFAPVSLMGRSFTFYPKQCGKEITNLAVLEAVKKLSPILGVINVQ
jgi:hypothetical protein